MININNKAHAEHFRYTLLILLFFPDLFPNLIICLGSDFDFGFLIFHVSKLIDSLKMNIAYSRI